jgi:hypothetical protein
MPHNHAKFSCRRAQVSPSATYTLRMLLYRRVRMQNAARHAGACAAELPLCRTMACGIHDRTSNQTRHLKQVSKLL